MVAYFADGTTAPVMVMAPSSTTEQKVVGYSNYYDWQLCNQNYFNHNK